VSDPADAILEVVGRILARLPPTHPLDPLRPFATGSYWEGKIACMPVSRRTWRVVWTIAVTIVTFSFGVFFGLGYGLEQTVTGQLTPFVFLYRIVFPWVMFPHAPNDLEVLFLCQLAYVFVVVEGIRLAYRLTRQRNGA
jgi:hypothetical protein